MSTPGSSNSAPYRLYPAQSQDSRPYYHQSNAHVTTSTASAYAHAQQQAARQSQVYPHPNSSTSSTHPYIPPSVQRQSSTHARRAPSLLADRAHSIEELAKLAGIDKYDRYGDIKQDLRHAEVYLAEGRRDLDGGDLEWAFVNLARTATLVLNKMPTNSGYNEMKQRHRDTLAENGNYCLERMSEIKPKLVDRYELWRKRNPNAKPEFDLARLRNAMAARDQEELVIRAQASREKRAASKEEAARRENERERHRSEPLPDRSEPQRGGYDEEFRRRQEDAREDAERKVQEDRRRQEVSRRNEAEVKAASIREAEHGSRRPIDEEANRAEIARLQREKEEEGRRREEEIARRKQQEALRHAQEAASGRNPQEPEYRRKLEDSNRRENDGIAKRQREIEAEAQISRSSMRPPASPSAISTTQVSIPVPNPSPSPFVQIPPTAAVPPHPPQALMPAAHPPALAPHAPPLASMPPGPPPSTLTPSSAAFVTTTGTTSSLTSSGSSPSTLLSSTSSSATSSSISLSSRSYSKSPSKLPSASNSTTNSQVNTPRQLDALPILPLESPTREENDPHPGWHHPQPQPAGAERAGRRANSFPPPITTTSPPPAGRHVAMQHPLLMSDHQRAQGYTPSLQSMFSAPIHNPPLAGLLFKPNNPEGPSMRNMPTSPDRPPAHIRHMWEQAGYGYHHAGSHAKYRGPSAPGDSRILRPEQVRDDAATVLGRELRIVKVPQDVLTRFLAVAAVNTARNRETCGLLMGKEMNKEFKVTTLLIPRQHATSDTCTMEEEELVSEFCEKRKLTTLGWIHTHPTQSCFMSSLDLHTHAAFQCTLPEFFAIVCAPKHVPDCGIFRLTDPPGLKTILKCLEKSAFHPHPERPIYTDADKGHVVWVDDTVLEIVDLR